MRPIISLALPLFFTACFMDNGSPSQPEIADSDTTDIRPNGTRKPAMPRVSYQTHDSIVTLDILGLEPGDSDWYWIFRNGKLLYRPDYFGHESDGYQYRLIDSLHDSGSYVYTVQYGYRLTDLSRKSPAFTYAYPGRSPSGIVSLLTGTAIHLTVTLELPPRTLAMQAFFERRIGIDGPIETMDTLAMGDKSWIHYYDTSLIPYDTMVYYRAAIREAESETWLAPTAWDSVHIYQATWNYIPRPYYERFGTGIQASILNSLNITESQRVFYYLYRSPSEKRQDGILCDSLPLTNSTEWLRDVAPDTGIWYYWVDAKDAHGRISPRSAPVPFTISGNVAGPAIESIHDLSHSLSISVVDMPEAIGYILERAADTTAKPVVVDTLILENIVTSPTFYDFPPSDGFWYYRVSAMTDAGITSPGSWYASDYFRREVTYSPLEATIYNLGPEGIRVDLPTAIALRTILYRSSKADGSDSVAVDSVINETNITPLIDAPNPGTWYYRIYRYEAPSGNRATASRTAWMPIDYSGKPVGPTVLRLSQWGTGIDVYFSPDPNAVGYIVERRPDTATAWDIIDTLSVFPSSEFIYADHPPHDGIWHYRARTLTASLTVTEPGAEMGTSTPWVYRVTYDTNLQAAIQNRGYHVECPLTTSASYGYYLYRSPHSDGSQSTLVDSSRVGEPDEFLSDTPAQGIWFYWLERRLPANTNSNAILRSLPLRIEFTGVPEVISLNRMTAGIALEYPAPASDDTLEIWRSSGQVADTASYTRVKKDWGIIRSSRWTDTPPQLETAVLYHYRLALRNATRFTGLGPARSFYYKPD